ncbi:hypothetical protein BU17DRAFT_81517 [Hysterangium stoloniferum]|nr:hypothetical protein BU17DRAFT_81517 [Hysterangium stoloniferum]
MTRPLLALHGGLLSDIMVGLSTETGTNGGVGKLIGTRQLWAIPILAHCNGTNPDPSIWKQWNCRPSYGFLLMVVRQLGTRMLISTHTRATRPRSTDILDLAFVRNTPVISPPKWIDRPNGRFWPLMLIDEPKLVCAKLRAEGATICAPACGIWGHHSIEHSKLDACVLFAGGYIRIRSRLRIIAGADV